MNGLVYITSRVYQEGILENQNQTDRGRWMHRCKHAERIIAEVDQLFGVDNVILILPA